MQNTRIQKQPLKRYSGKKIKSRGKPIKIPVIEFMLTEGAG